jgi:hypothetical protein
LGRLGRGGKGAYIVTSELARAIRTESEAAVCYWWGAGITTVSKWRRGLEVDRFNEGTRRLYSLWKLETLPDRAVRFRSRGFTSGAAKVWVNQSRGRGQNGMDQHQLLGANGNRLAPACNASNVTTVGCGNGMYGRIASLR